MVKTKDLKENWEKTTSQLKEAERFLEEKKPDEALYFIWIAAENLINCLKVSINGFYLKEHKAKADLLKEYFIRGTLKNDYSKLFEKLSKYRLAAEFHPYTSISKSYTEEDVRVFLKEIGELKLEIESQLLKKGVLK